MEKYLTVGVAGHVDHGKTALVRCLTGVDTDRLQEEKRRGLSIEPGIAPLTLPSGNVVALVDVPGHTDFMKNTIRGLSCVDAAVLVVAADDGVMPQTAEHLRILELMGVRRGFTVLSKADLADGETLELAKIEIADLTEGTFFQDQPIVCFSAPGESGLEEIKRYLERLVVDPSEREVDAPFRLWVDQVRGIAGFGTVVSGTILSGYLKEGDPLVLLPSGKETRTRSLESHHEKRAECFAGERVGINLHKVQLQEVERGMLLVNPGAVVPSRHLNVDIRVLPGVKRPLKNRQRVKLFLGTSVTNAMVVLMDRELLESGEGTLAQLRLTRSVPALPWDPFVICLLDIPTVIGGGRILEANAEKYRPAKASVTLPYLNAMQQENLHDTLMWFFRKRLDHPVGMDYIIRTTGLARKDVHSEIQRMLHAKELVSLNLRGYYGKRAYETLKAGLLQAIRKALKEDSLKETVNAEEVKAKVAPSVEQGFLLHILDELCHEGSLVRAGGGYQAPGITGNLSKEQEALIALLLDYASKSGLNPFSADTIWKLHAKRIDKKLIQKHLSYLKSQRKLVLLGDKRFLSAQALEEIKKRVGHVIVKKGAFAIGDFMETLGYGRSVAIPVVEYLDTIGFTRRMGDVRVLMKP